METEYQNFSQATGQPVEAIKSYYKQSPEQLDAFKHALLEKKAIDLIINHATIEIKTVKPEETSTNTDDNADDNTDNNA